MYNKPFGVSNSMTHHNQDTEGPSPPSRLCRSPAARPLSPALGATDLLSLCLFEFFALNVLRSDYPPSVDEHFGGFQVLAVVQIPV